MKTSETIESQLKQPDIAARALHLWEETGHHHHHDMELWLQAEAELGAALPLRHPGENTSEMDAEHASLIGAEELLAPAW